MLPLAPASNQIHDPREFARLYNQLVSSLTANEPADLRRYLVVPNERIPYAVGSTVRILEQSFIPYGPHGILVPASFSEPQPIDSMGVYLTLEDYIELADPGLGVGLGPDDAFEHFASKCSRLRLIEALAFLNHLSRSPEVVNILVKEFRQFLHPSTRSRFDAAMSMTGRPRETAFVHRQAILNAMLRVSGLPEATNPDPDLSPLHVAIILVHAVSVTLSGRHRDDGSTWATFPEDLTLEIIQNQAFNQPHDWYAAVDRHVRLWRTFETQVDDVKLRCLPTELLMEATGLDPEDFLALGFALYSKVSVWQESGLEWVSRDFGCDMSQDLKDRFCELACQTLSDLATTAGQMTSTWNFTSLQRRPILMHENHLLVLDETYLLQRVLEGIYWDIADHEAMHRPRVDQTRWSQAYAKMIELQVEDQAANMAPTLLNASDRVVYSEEDLRDAYGGRICDVVVYYGAAMCMIEVVSAQSTTLWNSVITSSDLDRDIERFVLKKARQLHDSALKVLADEPRLTGHSQTQGLSICPILVVGGALATNPLLGHVIDTLLEGEGLWNDSRIRPLAVINLAELETLEALTEGRESPLAIIENWKSSALRHMPLHVYLHDVYSGLSMEELRPRRMHARVDAAFQEVIKRLMLREAS